MHASTSSSSQDEDERPIDALILRKAANRKKRQDAERNNGNNDKQHQSASDAADQHEDNDFLPISVDTDQDDGTAGAQDGAEEQQLEEDHEPELNDELMIYTVSSVERSIRMTGSPEGPGPPATASLTSVSFIQNASTKPSSAKTPKTAVKHTLVGVQLVDDGEEITRNVEMMKFVRAPRYFDDAVDQPDTMRCFNCGQLGHTSRTCVNAAREKPCNLCAQFGHEARDCPARLCFKCGRPGHVVRDCPAAARDTWADVQPVCLRCGSDTCSCANKGDYFRYEGGCDQSYSAADLAFCKCYVCGRYGHLCCKSTPKEPARVSCYNCGSSEHLGEACPSDSRPHLAAERLGDYRRAQQEREAEYEFDLNSSYDYPRSRGDYRGGHGYERDGGRRGGRQSDWGGGGMANGNYMVHQYQQATYTYPTPQQQQGGYGRSQSVTYSSEQLQQGRYGAHRGRQPQPQQQQFDTWRGAEAGGMGAAGRSVSAPRLGNFGPAWDASPGGFHGQGSLGRHAPKRLENYNAVVGGGGGGNKRSRFQDDDYGRGRQPKTARW